jgi:hypothetical protein
VRFEHLNADVEVCVGNRGLPTVLNSITNIFEVLFFFFHQHGILNSTSPEISIASFMWYKTFELLIRELQMHYTYCQAGKGNYQFSMALVASSSLVGTSSS